MTPLKVLAVLAFAGLPYQAVHGLTLHDKSKTTANETWMPSLFQGFARKRVAVLTAGTMKRYMMQSTVHGLLEPLVREGHSVDYFLSLGGQQFNAWRSAADEFVPDPSLAGGGENALKTIVGNVSSVGANVRFAEFNSEVTLTQEEKVFVNSAQWNNFAARENLMKYMQRLNILGEKMEAEESKSGAYDFVVIVKDDALWVRPFSLKRLWNNLPALPAGASKDTPRGANLLCHIPWSTYDPGEKGFIEYIFVFERAAARPFLKQHGLLIRGAADKHANPDQANLLRYRSQYHDIESFSKGIAGEWGVNVTSVPPDLIPMQRGGRVRFENGSTQVCIHKQCDSCTDTIPFLEPKTVFPVCHEPWDPLRDR